MREINASELEEGMYIPYGHTVYKVLTINPQRREIIQVEHVGVKPLWGIRKVSNLRLRQRMKILDQEEVDNFA